MCVFSFLFFSCWFETFSARKKKQYVCDCETKYSKWDWRDDLLLVAFLCCAVRILDTIHEKRLLMSLFSEGKAWELGSLLASATEKVGVSGAGAGGGDFAMATASSTKRPRNSLSRCGFGLF